MLWEPELKVFAERKRSLIEASDRLRHTAQSEARYVAYRLRWVELARRGAAYVRPALVLGAAVVGLRRSFRRLRLVGAIGTGVALARGAVRLVRRLRN